MTVDTGYLIMTAKNWILFNTANKLTSLHLIKLFRNF